MGAKRERKPYYDEEPGIAGAVKYHRESCWAVGMIGAGQKRLKSWKKALQLGLQPCGVCKPFGYELGKASQPKELSSDPPPPALPARNTAGDEGVSEETAEFVCSRESIPDAFEGIRCILRDIASKLGFEVDRKTNAAKLIKLLGERASANFPPWLASMLDFMRDRRNRVAHPEEGDPLTDKQLAAWQACLEVFEEWANAWGFKR